MQNVEKFKKTLATGDWHRKWSVLKISAVPSRNIIWTIEKETDKVSDAEICYRNYIYISDLNLPMKMGKEFMLGLMFENTNKYTQLMAHIASLWKVTGRWIKSSYLELSYLSYTQSLRDVLNSCEDEIVHLRWLNNMSITFYRYQNPCPLCIPTRWTKTITSRYVCSRFWNDTLARNSFSPKRYLHSNYSRCTFISLSTVVCATTNRHIRNRFLWNSNSANVKSQNQVVKGIEDTAGSDFKIMTTLILILRYKLC